MYIKTVLYKIGLGCFKSSSFISEHECNFTFKRKVPMLFVLFEVNSHTFKDKVSYYFY